MPGIISQVSGYDPYDEYVSHSMIFEEYPNVGQILDNDQLKPY